jgi:hypothetical protein
MAFSARVLEIITNIEQDKKDVKPIYWGELTLEDKDFLFERAQKGWADDKKGYQLLREIYRNIGNDIPNKIKILQLIYVRNDIPLANKKSVLDNIKKELDNWRDSTKDAKQFNLYYGDYYLLIARNREDTGNLERTLTEYQSSIDHYQKAGALDRVVLVQQEVEQLKERKEQRNKPLPIEMLISQRGQLEAGIAQLGAQFTHIKSQTQSAQKCLTELEQKLKSEQEDWQAKQIELEKIKAEIELLRRKYPSTRAILEFMIALPQVANAPLWVEVLFLALKQGEMDDLSKQALERLAISHPQEAIPLLAEIAARAPEPFKIEKQQAQTGITQWFLLIAQARQEMQAEKHLKAAETLVKAWETFFALKSKK